MVPYTTSSYSSDFYQCFVNGSYILFVTLFTSLLLYIITVSFQMSVSLVRIWLHVLLPYFCVFTFSFSYLKVEFHKGHEHRRPSPPLSQVRLGRRGSWRATPPCVEVGEGSSRAGLKPPDPDDRSGEEVKDDTLGERGVARGRRDSVIGRSFWPTNDKTVINEGKGYFCMV